MKKLISIFSAICMVVSLIPFSAYAAGITPEISLAEFSEQLVEMQEEYEDEPVSNRLIVKSERKINELDSVDVVEGYNDLHIVQFDNLESAKQALEYYNDSKHVEYAEEDIRVSVCENTGGITYDNHLSWGSESIGVDDYVDYLGDVSTLPEVVVGIIDTGIDLDHEFLKDRIIPTGVNFSDSGAENSEDDDNGHGSHVAGIVVDNTTDNVKIKGYKCLNSNGSGTISSIALSINKAIEDNVNVINMSLGGKGKSQLLKDCIDFATNHNIAVCVSAGNNGGDASKNTPANVESAITVTAIDSNNGIPYWACTGAVVDIIAPGVQIYSSYAGNTYKTLNGTSMACPFVAASMAMIMSRYTDESVDEIFAHIDDSSKHVTSAFEELKGTPILYIGKIENAELERTALPTFSHSSGRYDDSISLEIYCENENAQIYYTLDGSRATKDNGILYTQPIIIDSVTSVHAVAYSNGRLKSLQSTAEYYLTHTDIDSNFVINSDGVITKYLGKNNYLTIPDSIDTITVTGIGNNVFRSSDLIMIKLPDTLTYIGNNAFANCEKLISVYANNIKFVDDNGFEDCIKLTDIDLTKLEKVGQYAFNFCESISYVECKKLTVIEDYAFSYLTNSVGFKFDNVSIIKDGGLLESAVAETIIIPNLEIVYDRAFEGCYKIKELDFPKLKTIDTGYMGAFWASESLEKINMPSLQGELPDYCFRFCNNLKSIVLNNVTSIGLSAFEECYQLEQIYAPKVKSIKENALFNCNNLALIFAPDLKELKSYVSSQNCKLYLSDSFADGVYSKCIYTIIAPSGSYAEQWAKENGHNFVPSDCRAVDKENRDVAEGINVHAKGKSICTSVAGLRFGFDWTTIPEIENFATNIEYGLIYSQKGVENLSIDTVDNVNVKSVIANNRVTNGDVTSFNLVILNIPSSCYDRVITARAYVCIDGMYFYSNVQKGSFSGVAELVLKDDDVDEAVKNAVKKLITQEV